MSASSKPLLITLIVLGLGATGFFVGKTLSQHDAPIVENTPETRPQVTGPIEIYEVANLSVGPLLKLQTVKRALLEDNVWGTTLPKQEAKDIQIAQDVVFFDDKNTTPVLMSSVKEIKESESNPEETVVVFDEAKGSYKQAVGDRADIVTMELIISKRLPLSALQKDETGQSFLWKVVREEGILVARQIFLEPDAVADDYFSVGHDIENPDLILIHPDNKLEDGSAIRIQKVALQAPIIRPGPAAIVSGKNKDDHDEEMEARRVVTEFAKSLGIEIPPGTPASESCGFFLAAPPQVGSDSAAAPASSDSCGSGSASSGACGSSPTLSVIDFLLHPAASAGACGSGGGSGGGCGTGGGSAGACGGSGASDSSACSQ